MIQWYVIRASGVVALGLLTVTVVLGLLNRSRVTSDRWPRFVIDRLHRNASLLAIAFLCVHIVTAITDTWVSVRLVDVFIPFRGTYRPLWVGLGATAVDLLAAVIVTSLVRVRLGVKTWRGVHWLAYLAWASKSSASDRCSPRSPFAWPHRSVWQGRHGERPQT